MDKWIVILYKFDQVKFVLKIQLRERRVQLCNDVISSTSDFNADLKYVSYDAKQHNTEGKFRLTVIGLFQRTFLPQGKTLRI